MSDTEGRIGYSFKNQALLRQALTHPSYGGDRHVPDYQRLEFLGDAVLELYVSRLLYDRYPDLPEGKLTRMRADLVCEKSLSQAARAIGLCRDIYLSVGEERSGGRNKNSILCDVFEAVIGAIYMDGGARCAGDFIASALKNAFESITDKDEHLDDKSRLQALMQASKMMPEYELLSVSGPDHKPIFKMRVSAGGKELGIGEGGSKQAAQLAAAREALIKLKQN